VSASQLEVKLPPLRQNGELILAFFCLVLKHRIMGAISNDDLDKISQAAAIILDSSQAFLDFPVPPEPSQQQTTNEEDPASTSLTYSFYGALTAELSTDWTICSGLVLTNASLNICLRLSGQSENPRSGQTSQEETEQ
jgi:hypothetical protein